jgi:hypothetical protein
MRVRRQGGLIDTTVWPAFSPYYTLRTTPTHMVGVCVIYIGVVSVVILYNCVYYCPSNPLHPSKSATAANAANGTEEGSVGSVEEEEGGLEESAFSIGKCHVIELHKMLLFIYIPCTKYGLLTLFTYTLTGLFTNNVFSFYALSYSDTS